MEISPACWEVARGFGKLLGAGGSDGGEVRGAGLIVDYGDDKAFGRSWRVSLFDRKEARRSCQTDLSFFAVANRDLGNIRLSIPFLSQVTRI